MTETTDSKTRKKLFAEVRALIAFEAPSSHAKPLAEHFLARRGIELVGEVSYEPLKRNVTSTSFAVRYRVHGGWRSDFMRKLQIDATDMGIELRNIDISVERREIPAECPRKECFPCSLALNPGLGRINDMVIDGKVHVSESIVDVKPDTVVSRRKRFRFLGGNI